MKKYFKKIVVFLSQVLVVQINRKFIRYVTVRELLINDSVKSSANYAAKYMKLAMMFEERSELWDFCIEIARNKTIKSSKKKAVLEFGVLRGQSLNYFAKSLPEAKIFGFDSFEGLDENWTGNNLPKGAFNLGGKTPLVLDNVELIKGRVQKTMPDFLPRINNLDIALIHFDMDTYTPTKFVLDSLMPWLKPETIVIFDEYFGYRSWENHEFKAWKQICKKAKLKYEYLAFTNTQVGLLIT